jgi:hypothetical protein
MHVPSRSCFLPASAVLATGAVWALRVVRDAEQFDFVRNGDLYAYFLPMYELAFSELRAGRLLLWNPWLLNGIPGLATLEVGLLYPPHLLYAVLPSALAMGVLSFLHLLLAILFTIQLARTLGLGAAAALLAGLAFGFSHGLASLFWLPGLEPLPWLPLGLTAIERALRDGARRWLAVLAAATALPILCGGYQVTFYVLSAFGLYAVVRGGGLLASGRAARATALRIAWVAAAATAGLALAAPQWLPTLELAQASVRPPDGLTAARLFPFGRPLPDVAALWRQAVAPPAQFLVGYTGAAPLALAAAGLFARGFRARLFCAVLVVWSSLAALAPDAYVEIRRLVPVLGWFRLPHRTLVLGQLGVALLAGAGWDALRSAPPNRRILAVGALGTVASLAIASRWNHPLWWNPALLAGLATFAAAVRPEALVRPLALLAVGVVVIDLTGATRNAYRLPYVAQDWRRTTKHDEALRGIGELAGPWRVLLLGAERNLPEWGQKSGLRARLRAPADYEPLAPARYADLFSFVATRSLWPTDSPRPFLGAIPEFFRTVPPPVWGRLFRLLGVRYFVIRTDMLRDPRIAAFAEGLVPVSLPTLPGDPGSGLAVFEDPDALPRAWTVEHAECVTGARPVLARLTSPDFDPRRSVLLEADCPRGATPREGSSGVTLERDDAGQVRARVDLERPGFLVLSDTFDPGWRARVDGEPVEIRRANWAFRAVALPAGRHAVDLHYEPASFRVGLGLAGLAAGVGSLAACHGAARARRPAPTAAERAA